MGEKVNRPAILTATATGAPRPSNQRFNAVRQRETAMCRSMMFLQVSHTVHASAVSTAVPVAWLQTA